jgi:plasmid stabilization system protein ParE
MKIIWSILAVERMEEISDYIAHDSPAAAGKWIDDLFARVGLLSDNPDMGRIVPEVESASIRELVFGNYRIIYRRAAHSVTVLTVRSFKQILPLQDIPPER